MSPVQNASPPAAAAHPVPALRDSSVDHLLSVLRSSQQAIWATRILALFAFLVFLATAFRAGWQRLESDFPNYYTAAGLVEKREPLDKFYDWTWFARQMVYAGIEHQLGTYTAQTPLTMLPMVGLARLPVESAKRVWLVCSLLFLAGALSMLSRVTKFRIEQIWLLVFCGIYTLFSNFLLGQYYVFLLLLLTLAFYLLHRERPWSAGFVAGMAFALKLYGGPLLLYFAVKRNWKAVAGMSVALAGAGALAIALFGLQDVRFYLTQILPRSLEGGSINPFHPGNPALSTMLRRWFVPETELNPTPWWNAPWLFFFLRTFVSLGIIASVAFGVLIKPGTERRDFAWFLIATLLLSTSVASYSYILVSLAVILLLHESGWRRGCYFAASYVLLTLPLRPDWLFPKVWILLGLFIAVGWDYWGGLPVKLSACVILSVLIVAVFDATRHMQSYLKEPGRHFEQITGANKTLLSTYPAITPAGIFFQSLGPGHYVVRWLHDGRAEEIPLDGNAFRPLALPDGTIAIELARHGTSGMVSFDPGTRKGGPIPMPVPLDGRESALSPDGKWLAYTVEDEGPKHLWLRNISSGRAIQLTGGNCNSSWPAWQLDSRSLVFASDCGRAFGLPALYNAPVPPQLEQNP
jgi:hypothetical protein